MDAEFTLINGDTYVRTKTFRIFCFESPNLNEQTDYFLPCNDIYFCTTEEFLV